MAVIEYAAETLSGIPVHHLRPGGHAGLLPVPGLQDLPARRRLTLVIMNLPTIMRTTQESLKTVPQSYREGAFGLGAGKWRVIRTIVLPGCVDGVITGCILAVGRILGETAALLFTAGFAHTCSRSLHATCTSLAPPCPWSCTVYAKEEGEFDVAFAIAAILMVLALSSNWRPLVGKAFGKEENI